MKRLTFVMSALVLLVILLMACGNNMDVSKVVNKKTAIDFEIIKKNLESGRVLERPQIFSERKFAPYLSGKWIGDAVSYGCYREGQAPGKIGPGKQEILADLNIVSKYWNLIRVYNADDDTERILEVIREHKLPIRMMLGIWLENETEHPEQKKANISNVLRGIDLANRFEDIVIAINVGNETQVFWSWHKMNLDNLINYLRVVRKNTIQPVATADDYNFWNTAEAKPLAAEVDFIVTHIYPLWNGKTLDEAIPWMDSTFHDIQARFPEKTIVLGETGWATAYNADKKGPGEQGSLITGAVSLAAQEKYLRMHNAWVNTNKITTFLFEAFDEPWKGGGENSDPDEIEKNWGVFYKDRTAKASFENFLNYRQTK